MPRPYIPVDIERRVRDTALNRCGYCLSPQSLVMAHLEIEHIVPRSVFSPDDPAADDESNLWLACPICNGHKSDKMSTTDPETGEVVSLFNPRTQRWSEHFRWSEDGIRVIGLTPIGRATVVALQLADDADALLVRANWVSAGWHPPKNT
jgi:hypothetical protein